MLSEEIRESTKSAHLNLEKLVVQQLKSINNESDYAAFLIKFHAYFSQVERSIAPFINESILPDYADRRNSTYIKHDIESLGSLADTNLNVEVTKIDTTVGAIGALYVMEGSIMGGRIIVQMLQKLGITKGLSFFSGYGPETGQKWEVFTKVMNDTAKTDEQRNEAIKTANETFKLFENLFV
jgi:heme oxygenase